MKAKSSKTKPASKVGIKQYLDTESAAILTIKHADTMTKRGRKAVAKWIRGQADFLESHGDRYGQRFTARYLYNKS